MDAEEALKLLADARLQCRVLEVEKEAEALKAAKFRNIILATLAGERSSDAIQPEASRVLHAARSALAPPALPAANVRHPNLYHGCLLVLTWTAVSYPSHRVRRC